MPGLQNIFMGGGIFLLGAIITGATYAIAPGGYYVVAGGAIIVGAIQAAIGVLQWFAYQVNSPAKKAKYRANVDVKIIVRSMLAVAAADGKLEVGERVMIQMITSSMFGSKIDDETLDKVFNEMSSKGYSYTEEIVQISQAVTQTGAEFAVMACTMVAMSDGEFHESEEKLVSQLAAQCGVTGKRLELCISDATSSIARIVSAQQPSELH